jgi:hypothetical protein
MPIQQGRIGGGRGGGGGFGIFAAPDGGWTPQMSPNQKDLPLGGWTPLRSPGTMDLFRFKSPSFSTSSLYITGVCRNSAGGILPDCTVDLFVTGTDQKVASTISNGSGEYTFQILVSGPFYIVAYHTGSPDLAGTTVNTLVGA